MNTMCFRGMAAPCCCDGWVEGWPLARVDALPELAWEWAHTATRRSRTSSSTNTAKPRRALADRLLLPNCGYRPIVRPLEVGLVGRAGVRSWPMIAARAAAVADSGP